MLGNILRQEREKQNLTIKDVEQETSIRGLYIAAIENEDYDVLPGEVYLKGFIKTYGNFLQLNGAEMLKIYYQEKAGSVVSDDAAVMPEGSSPPVAQLEPTQTLSEKVERAKQQQKAESSSIIKIIAGIGLVICIGGTAYWVMDDTEPEPKAVPQVTRQTVKQPVPAKQSVAPTPKSQIFELQAKYSGACWTKVEADGKLLYEGTPQQGETLNWQADKEIAITVGNAGAIEIVLAGKSEGKLGNVGEVITKKFSAPGVAAKK